MTLLATASTTASTLLYVLNLGLSTAFTGHHLISLQKIEPCAFPAALGGKGTCSFEELSKARPIVQDMCNFFNATLYDDYEECDLELSEDKTYEILAEEEFGEISH
jgi:hypothetical protein